MIWLLPKCLLCQNVYCAKMSTVPKCLLPKCVTLRVRSIRPLWTRNIISMRHLVNISEFHVFLLIICTEWMPTLIWKTATSPDSVYLFPFSACFLPLGIIRAASSQFGTYRLCEQRRFRRACASAQSRQNLRYSLIQAVSQEEPSDRKPDPWPLWMAGHAQSKFVMTECSKTQIRLTRPIT